MVGIDLQKNKNTRTYDNRTIYTYKILHKNLQSQISALKTKKLMILGTP